MPALIQDWKTLDGVGFSSLVLAEPTVCDTMNSTEL
jgi:hypothetical protein